MQLLLEPFNPSTVDIKIDLLESNDIVYTETKEDVSLTSNTELKIDWPFLLNNNEKYTVRTKILTHRLNSQPLINTYIASFTAGEDVEILPGDVETDEYGASVTLRGNSQVPFDGFIDISATNRETNEIKTYRQQVEEILTSGKEDTAGVVWKELGSGTYDVSIRAVNIENIALDKYETVLRIPEVDVESEIPSTSSTPTLAGLTGGDMVFGVLPEKQMKDALLTSGRYLVPGDGYKAVVGSSIARKHNLKVGDELEMKSKRLQRTSSITNTRNVSVVGILEYTGSFFDGSVQIPLDRTQKFYKMENTVSVIYAQYAPGSDPSEIARRIELSVEKVKRLK